MMGAVRMTPGGTHHQFGGPVLPVIPVITRTDIGSQLDQVRGAADTLRSVYWDLAARAGTGEFDSDSTDEIRWAVASVLCLGDDIRKLAQANKAPRS